MSPKLSVNLKIFVAKMITKQTLQAIFLIKEQCYESKSEQIIKQINLILKQISTDKFSSI